MKPERPTPELELASAYLDGEVTAAERARVEASPALLALVASMRQVAVAVATVPAPAAAGRESAIAAALSAFDGLHAADNNVVSLASRRRWPKAVMATAAAVVLLGAVSISVLNRPSSDKSEASREADAKADTGTAEDAFGAAAPATADGENVQAFETALAIDSPEQLRELALPEPTIADSPPAETTAAGGSDEGDNATRAQSANVDALACMTDEQVFLADIYYQGTLAIAVRDTVTGVTEAIDATCTVLARVNP